MSSLRRISIAAAAAVLAAPLLMANAPTPAGPPAGPSRQSLVRALPSSAPEPRVVAGPYDKVNQCLPSVTGALMDCFAWRSAPTAADTTPLYPAAALRAAREGVVTLSCVINTEGGLKDCKVSGQFPIGSGFDRAALRLAPLFKAGMPTTGRSLAGEAIVVPVWFAATVDPEPAPTSVSDARVQRLQAMATNLGCSFQTAHSGIGGIRDAVVCEESRDPGPQT